MNSADNSTATHRPATAPSPSRAILSSVIVLIWISLLVYPVLSNTYLPLYDLPNHIARLEILANLDDPVLSLYYRFEPGIKANSTMDIFVLFSGWDGDIYALARWSMAFYLINFQISALVLYRCFWGRWSLWPLVAGLVAYSGPFFWGFQNFIVSVPIAIYVLALWIWCARFDVLKRILLLTTPIVAVYFLHSLSFAILALCVAGYELQALLQNRQRRFLSRLLAAIALSLPFWLPVAHQASQISVSADRAGRSMFGGLQSRIDALFSLTGTPNVIMGHWIELINNAGVLLLILPLFMLRKQGARLQIAPHGKGILIALALAALLAPEWLGGVWAVHTRIPFVLFLLFVSMTRWRDPGRIFQRCLIALASVALLIRVISLDAYSRVHTSEVADLIAMYGELDEGISLGALLVPIEPDASFAWRRYKLEKYAIVENRALVPTMIFGVHNLAFTRLAQSGTDTALAVPGCTGTERNRDTPPYLKTYLLHVGPLPQEYRQNPQLQPVASNDNYVILQDCR